MFRTLLQHKLVVLGVALVAAGALWYGMSESSSQAPTIVASGAAQGTTGSVANGAPLDKDSQRILEILLALRSVKLDDAIFSSNSFISLKDFSTPIVPEPVGRADPFAPLGTAASAPAPAALLPGASATSSLPASEKVKTLESLQKSQTKK